MTAQQLLLHVETTTGDESDLVNDLTWDLMETLRESPAESVERPRGKPEAKTKGPGLELAELVVSFTGGLPGIVGLVRAWLRRHPDAKVRIELGGDVLEVEHASPEVQATLTEAFLARHSPEAST